MGDDAPVMQPEGTGGRHRSNDTFPPSGPDTGVPPRITTDLMENPRLVIFWALVLPAALVGGARVALDGGHAAAHRLVGLGVALTSALLFASFALRYVPRLVHHGWWARSRTRRLGKGVLLWAWFVCLVLGLLWTLVSLVTPL